MVCTELELKTLGAFKAFSMNLYQHNELFLYILGICLTQMQQNQTVVTWNTIAMRINTVTNNMSDSHKQKVD